MTPKGKYVDLGHPDLKEGTGKDLQGMLWGDAVKYKKEHCVPIKEAREHVFTEYAANLNPPITAHQLTSFIMHDINTHMDRKDLAQVQEGRVSQTTSRGRIVRGQVVSGKEDPFVQKPEDMIRGLLYMELQQVEPGQTYMFPCKDHKEVELARSVIPYVTGLLKWQASDVPGMTRKLRSGIIVKGLTIFIHRYA